MLGEGHQREAFAHFLFVFWMDVPRVADIDGHRQSRVRDGVRDEILRGRNSAHASSPGVSLCCL